MRMLHARDTNIKYLLHCQTVKNIENLESANFISGVI